MKSILVALLAVASLCGQTLPYTVSAGDNVISVSLPGFTSDFVFLNGKQLYGTGAPSATCSALVNLGVIYTRTDAAAPLSSSYACVESGSSTYTWELQNSPNAALRTNNLSDLSSAPTARTNLGLGSAAVMAGPSGAILGTSDVQTVSNKTMLSPSLGAGSSPVTETWTAGSGGVTANTLVQTDTSAPLKMVNATTGVYGVAMSNVAASSSVEVARYGTVNCTTDAGGATAGDLVVIGTGTVIDCKDSGQTSSAGIAITTRIVGVFRSTATAGNPALVELTPGHYGTLVTAATVTVTLQGTIQGNGSGFAANLPAATAPFLCPASSGCANTVGSYSMPVLEWPTAQSTYYAWWDWPLTPSYIANSAIPYVVEYFSADSTHAAIITPAWACVTTGNMTSAPSFTSVTPINLTASASSGRTVSSTQTFTPTCGPGNRVYLRVTSDTNTNALTSGWDLMSIQLTGTH